MGEKRDEVRCPQCGQTPCIAKSLEPEDILRWLIGRDGPVRVTLTLVRPATLAESFVFGQRFGGQN